MPINAWVATVPCCSVASVCKRLQASGIERGRSSVQEYMKAEHWPAKQVKRVEILVFLCHFFFFGRTLLGGWCRLIASHDQKNLQEFMTFSSSSRAVQKRVQRRELGRTILRALFSVRHVSEPFFSFLHVSPGWSTASHPCPMSCWHQNATIVGPGSGSAW